MKLFILALVILFSVGCADEGLGIHGPIATLNQRPAEGVESMKNYEYFAEDNPGDYGYKAKIDLTADKKVFLTLFQNFRGGSYRHYGDYVATCDESLKCKKGSVVITVSVNGDKFHFEEYAGPNATFRRR